MRLRVYRGRASRGAVALARRMEVPLLRQVGSRFRPRYGDVVINWGSTSMPDMHPGRELNPPEAVRNAVDKVECLIRLQEEGVPTLNFVRTRSAARLLQREGRLILARTQTRASGGAGIVVVYPDDVIPDARLYTEYFKGRDEYRIHVVGGQVIDRAIKRRRLDAEPGDFQIRNTANGYIFARENVGPVGVLDEAAVAAVQACGLDFGAVDIKCNRQQTKCAVIEVNSAPGLEGTTLDRYASALQELAYES